MSHAVFCFQKEKLRSLQNSLLAYSNLGQDLCDCQMLFVPQNIGGSSNRHGDNSSWS